MSDFQKFYDSISDDYDGMTGDSGRWERDHAFLSDMLQKYQWQRILVAGCGTGGEAVLLAKLGARVVGVDGSFGLLEIAQEKATEAGIKVDWFHDDLRVLKHPTLRDFDAVICRGNTLPHFLTSDDLKAALSTFKRIVRPGGHVVLGWLNYSRILKIRERLVGTRAHGDKTYLRFYDFKEDHMIFNVLRLHRDADSPGGKVVVSWNSTQLKPWTLDEVEPMMINAGWSIAQRWGGIDGTYFNVDTSPDILLIAQAIA